MSGILRDITPGAKLKTPDGTARYAGLIFREGEEKPRVLAYLAHNDPLTGLPLVKSYPLNLVSRKVEYERKA